MNIRKVFIAEENDRLRLGWRLLVQFGILLILSALFALIVLPIAKSFTGSAKMAIAQMAGLGGTIVSIYLARRFLDKRSLVSLGLKAEKKSWADLLFGFVLGGLVMFLLFGIEWMAGWIESPTFIAWRPEVVIEALFMFFFYIQIGIQEELLARGYWLQNMAENMGWKRAVVLSSIFFAVGHLGNGGINFIAILSLIGAGILLAYGRIRAGQLWLPIGLHIGWDFFESALGFPVSGIANFQLLNFKLKGPEILLGGTFGPEAGLLSFFIMALAGVLIYWWSRDSEKRLALDSTD